MRRKSLLLAVAAASLAISVDAQTAPTSGIPLVVANIPYTAQEWTTATLVQSDGSTLQTVRRVDVTRNTAGSNRREARILASASTTAQPTGSLYIDIHDVPNSLAEHLSPNSLTASVNQLRKSARPLLIPVAVPVGAAASGTPQNLGYQSIAGFNAIGTRRLYVFPAGTKNPTQPVTQTTDIWYSPDLQANLLTQTSDTLGNSTTVSLTQIAQGEPDPTLFTVPQNYTTTIIGIPAQSPH
jgi:hypothetical protein